MLLDIILSACSLCEKLFINHFYTFFTIQSKFTTTMKSSFQERFVYLIFWTCMTNFFFLLCVFFSVQKIFLAVYMCFVLTAHLWMNFKWLADWSRDQCSPTVVEINRMKISFTPTFIPGKFLVLTLWSCVGADCWWYTTLKGLGKFTWQHFEFENKLGSLATFSTFAYTLYVLDKWKPESL